MHTTLIGNPAPMFDLARTRVPVAASDRARLSDYRGRWLIIIFYPRDFSLVCPTELVGLSQRHEELEGRNCDLLAIGCDSVELHERWITTPKAQGGLGGLNFPLASDPDGETARAYGVYQERDHVAVRGTFIIDPEGLIQYQVVHSLSVGRRSQEVLRVLTALQSGGLCREDWMSDDPNIDAYASLRPGQVFSHYLIQSEIGAGTFAQVYLARDLQLDRPVALKVFRKDCPVTPSTVLAEARSAAALNHPNVSTIYAVDDTAGLPIISMEFVAGQSLLHHARGKTLPADNLLDVSRQIAAGMSAAHDAGIVHGDLKPENIMISPDGLVKILDFGLARRLHRLQMSKPDETTELGVAESGDGVYGTPRYLSPEQTLGEPASFASDVFALGVVLFELATGRAAFADGNVLQVLHRIRNLDGHAMASEAGEPFAGLLRSMLVTDPAERTITMRRIVDEINSVCESA